MRAGVLLSPAALVGACGGNYSAMTSVVYSPDFPDAYAAGRVCYWTIRVPGAAHIHFNFTLFDIRDSTDMVELLDGYTHPVLVRFNGRNRPPSSFNISLDFIILYFFSDRINQAQGFAVLYQGKVPASLGPPLHLIMMCGPQVVLACQELPNQLAGFPTSCFITYACCMIQKRDATCEFCCFSHSHGSFHGKAKRITKRAEIGRIRRFQRGHLVHPPVSEQPCQLPEPGSLRPS